jgi:LysM repeat protein
MKRIRFLSLGLALVLLAIILTACTRSLSSANDQQPLPTPTIVGEIPTPMPNDPLAQLNTFATQTAMAEEAMLTGETPTPEPVMTEEPTQAPIEEPTATPTPEPVIVVTSEPLVVPASYALQKGEFPYCIARRFDINPNQLLAANGLSPAQGRIYQPGMTLVIPQNADPFPGERALMPHPDVYTVQSADETIYGIACKYGDVNPMDIAAYNGLAAPYTLEIGQILQIP